MTISVKVQSKIIYFNDDHETQQVSKLTIWDTAGQEKYGKLTKTYFRKAKAALIVYDITNAHSFERAKEWAKELDNQPDDIVKVLVANKQDLEIQRQVD